MASGGRVLSVQERWKHVRAPLSPAQTLSLGFLLTIIVGTLLLKLPIATTTPISFIDALFTATSATTVTGLVVVSTGHDFTTFGQVVIMVLIQIGGLGLMTCAMLIVILLGRKIGLKNRILIQESFNQTSVGGIIRLVKVLFIFAIAIETVATGVLATQWVPEYGWSDGLYISIFHAISAFNNAGFSLWDDSLMGYVGNPVVNLVITASFIIGGIGFTVLYDVWQHQRFKDLALHSKIMITGTLVVNVFSMLVIFTLEFHNPNTLGALSFGDKLWASYFQAVTPRTAGFNTLDTASLDPETTVFLLALMFIGAGSASTGSGIKLTTFLVIVLTMVAYLKGQKEPVVFHRSLSVPLIERALTIALISGLAVFVGIFFLSMTENAPFDEIIFEVFSAFGTVGLSLGLTPDLSAWGKLVIIVIMFMGRIGPVTLAFALGKPREDRVRYAKGDIFTG